MKSVAIIKEKGGEKWLESLRGKPNAEIKEKLMVLPGVGRKVADCIALFSLDDSGAIPVDTHVFQIAKKLGYVSGLKDLKSINDTLYQ